jgi:predicted nuclease of predicted toxin-antitoxin system
VKIWVDAQLSPLIAQWLSSTYGVEKAWPVAERLLKAGEKIIEISDTTG